MKIELDNKDNTVLYYVKLTNLDTNVVGYKIGITINGVESRFRALTTGCSLSLGTSSTLLEIIYAEEMSSSLASRREAHILDTYSEYLIEDPSKVMTIKSTGKQLRGGSEVFFLDLRNIDKNFYDNSADAKGLQTPTQKSISALKFLISETRRGENPAKGTIASKFGISRNNLYLAEQLLKVSDEDIIEFLFKGNKINIGDSKQPKLTDSLKQLVNHFKSKTKDVLELSEETSSSVSDYTEEDLILVEELLNDVYAQLPRRLEKLFASKAFSRFGNSSN